MAKKRILAQDLKKKYMSSKQSKSQKDTEEVHFDGLVSEEEKETLKPLIINRVEVQSVKALVEEWREIKLRKQEEFLNKFEKVALSLKKGKAGKTNEEYREELEKELDEESPLEEEVVTPSKKRKVIMKKEVLGEQFAKKCEEKGTKKSLIGEMDLNVDEDVGLGDENVILSIKHININFKIEKGLLPFKGDEPLQDSLSDPLVIIGNAFKGVEDATLTPVVTPSKKTLEKVVDNQLLNENQMPFEDAGETHKPSSPKQTNQASTGITKHKEPIGMMTMKMTYILNSSMRMFFSQYKMGSKKCFNAKPHCKNYN
ncbi:protein MNN4-like [Cucumis melo var. makuwa]|uniref:Protein MNN4-like n=1 Tax=Cucumis melo var. makuwa TaxID=1194695 RepID=A0A5A7TJX0_CUCMM|nr:protein MNN4-like [Cucumis melo var. makuwa]